MKEVNEVSMPGFTAEASIGKTGGHYKLAAGFSVRPSGEVQPQIGRELACYLKCMSQVGSEEGWSDICAYYCTHR